VCRVEGRALGHDHARRELWGLVSARWEAQFGIGGTRREEGCGAGEQNRGGGKSSHYASYIGPCGEPLEHGTLKFVMDTSPARTSGVNEVLVESVPLVAPAQSEGFAELYERTFPRVYAYVASLLRDRAAAEDVTSQAFERAYRKRRSYRPARGSMDAWLFGIARNAALDELRKRKRRAVLETDPEDTVSPTPEDHAELALRRETVRAALASLGGQERDLIALKFAGGLSNAEIARVLGMSESNAGTRLHRTITKLREACHE
jgi:RNA polymerase sigma-70 factor, ECF subfamily